MKLILLITAVVSTVSAESYGFVSYSSPSYFGYTPHPFGYSTFTTTNVANSPGRFFYSTGAPFPGFQYTVPATPLQVPAPAPIYTQSQYHTQNENGESTYGYSYPGQAASVVRDSAGNERGSYSYIDPTGKEVKATYTAGSDGFKIESNVLPQAPTFNPELPQPVSDTVEVAAARSEHLRALEDAKARSIAADTPTLQRKKRTVYTAPLLTAAFPISYASSYSYRVDKPALKIAVTPLKAVAVAPAPIVKAAPVVKTLAVAPVSLVKAAPAPIVRVAPAPLLKAYAPVKTVAYSYPRFYNAYSPLYAPARTYTYSHPYAYGFGYTPLTYSNYLG